MVERLQTHSYRSHAKINLFLEVEGRRDDGFHDLDTLFLEIEFADELRFTWDPDSDSQVSLECNLPHIPTDQSNLILQSLKHWQSPSGQLDINLNKQIPSGGGLGGGSSNAAAVFHFLQDTEKTNFSGAQLNTLALGVGSDVPFFIDGFCQRGRGRGELLDKYPVPELHLVLLLPPISCPTGQVFTALRNQEYQRRSIEPMLELLDRCQSSDNVDYESALLDLSEQLFNRLEVVSLELWPDLQNYKMQLEEAGCLGTLMSGSGSTLFGLARSPEHAKEIASQVANSYVTRSRIQSHGA